MHVLAVKLQEECAHTHVHVLAVKLLVQQNVHSLFRS